MTRDIYLDNNATTKALPEVCSAILEALGDGFGNPSSVHGRGEAARRQLRQARHNVATLIGAEPDQITFTGSGTEANNMVLLSALARAGSKRCRIVTTSIEHSSILKTVEHIADQAAEVVIVPVDRDGLVDLERLDSEMTSKTALVSIQWVNNETGVIQPIETIARICRERAIPFHTDACQAAGKLPLHVETAPAARSSLLSNVDLFTLTAHKIHGPQGVAALFARDPAWLVSVFHGGPQESNLRPGTENLPGIVGFAKSAEVRSQQFHTVVESFRRLRDQFEQRVLELVPDVTINGQTEHRVCNTTNLCFRGIDGQALVARLDQEGIHCSQSSACTNRRPEPSYVLRAMGLSEEDAYSSVRFSIGVFNTVEEIETAAVIIRDICAQLRGFARRIHNPYHAVRT